MRVFGELSKFNSDKKNQLKHSLFTVAAGGGSWADVAVAFEISFRPFIYYLHFKHDPLFELTSEEFKLECLPSCSGIFFQTFRNIPNDQGGKQITFA